MYVTKEPCVMCAGAIVSARIKKVVWSMTDNKCGGMTKFNILSNDNLNHKVLVESGLLEKESKKMMQEFFSENKKKKKINNLIQEDLLIIKSNDCFHPLIYILLHILYNNY